MKIYTKKFNIFEYIITVISSVILSLSIFVGLNFNVSILDIIFLSSVFVALLTFLFKRPQLIIAFLSLFILVDLYYFYMKKDVLTKVVVDIDRYINWLYIYMGETNWPDGFSQLTSRYFLTTVILGIFVVALAITFLNSILKSYFLTMLFGILVLVFQWYNYIDKAYTYLIFYIAVSFINMSINYYQKAGNGKASIVGLLIISIVFSSISTAIAYALPKSFQPVVWKSMNDKFYATFPFTKTWRNGIGNEGTTTTFSTDFGSFSQDLGGPESVSDQIVMRVKSDESTYLRGEVFDTYENNRWSNSEIQHNFGNDNYFPPAFSKGLKYTIKKLEIYPVAMNTNIIFSPWQPYHVSINNIYDKSSLALTSMGRRIKSPYVVEYYKPDISVKDLEKDKAVASDDMKRYLQYPDNLPERVKELALSITKDKKTDYDKVKAIEQYLRNTYKYNLDVPETPSGRDFVDYFLFDLKQGYCTYFATSMVIMLRTIGIPARYVVGFKMPPPPIFGDNYDIEASYAHAWVEVHFQNSGWVIFEPTAIYSETFSQAAGADSGTPSSTQPNTSTGNVAIPKTNVNQNKMQDNIVKNQAGNNTITRRNMYTTIIIIWLLITLALAITAAIKYVLLKKYLGSNKNAYVYYYNKILKSLGKRGLRKDDSETTIEYQERVMSAGFKDFDRVTKVYNDLAYGNVEPSKDDVVYIKEYLKRNIRNRKSLA